MTIDLASGNEIITPSSIFFPSLSATRLLTAIEHGAFEGTSINMVIIPRPVQIPD
jgi:hypothetical protein